MSGFQLVCLAVSTLLVVGLVLMIAGMGKRKGRAGGFPKMRQAVSREDDGEP